MTAQAYYTFGLAGIIIGCSADFPDRLFCFGIAIAFIFIGLAKDKQPE